MRKELILHPFQLEIGDLVLWDGQYFIVHNLKGSHVRGRGLMVDVLLSDGWHRVDIMLVLKVYRHV